MVSSPPRRALCPSRWLSLVCKIPVLLLGLSETNTVGYYAIQEYLAHYHHERNHQGLGNQLITQAEVVGGQTGHVVRRERLGGLLSYYHREAA